MANPEHLNIFRQGVKSWNQWRNENLNLKPDLSHADLSDTDLSNTSILNTDMSHADLSESNFTDADFCAVNLLGSTFKHTNFIKVIFPKRNQVIGDRYYFDIFSSDDNKFNLSNTNLSFSILRKANFLGVKFSDVIMCNVNFTNANFVNVNMEDERFIFDSNLDLSGANFIECDLRNLDLKRYFLKGCNLSKSDLSDMDLSKINFESINLSGAKITRANLSNVILTKATLKNADLSQANLNYAKFHEADCEEINLNESDLSYSYFFKANMIRANLYQSKCYQTDFTGANLESSVFGYSHCLRASFYQSNLRSSVFNGANITFANFQQANLQKSSLYATNAINCNFFKADLTDACLAAMRGIDANFSEANLTGACIEDWNINAKTNLQNILCDYVYNKSGWDDDGKFLPSDRLPHNSLINFKDGEFEKLIQKAQHTVDLIFYDSIDWEAFSQTFFQLEVTNPESKAKVLGINFRGNLLVVTVEISSNILSGDYHRVFMEGYNFAKQELAPQYEARLRDKDRESNTKDQQINELISKVSPNVTQYIQKAYGVTGITPNQIINPPRTDIIEGGYNEEE